ncbi:MAG TPA: class I SAM-dependent methyltransferase [Chitinophagaceae bacterium]|nr:class I SAM-dependent methyltransferase [Chitinophagaceae bacterium]
MSVERETMERIIPDNISEDDAAARLSLKLHLERYEFAYRHLVTGRILDIACGVGYGTYLLAECSGQNCTGVDVSGAAIEYATNRYGHPKIRFIRDELLGFRDDEGFENIVSLETIEHIPDPGKVADHLCGLLKPGGRLIISAPVTPSTDGNPYHVNDFTERSFRKLFTERGLKEIASLQQRQPYSLREVLQKKSPGDTGKRPGLVQYYLSHPGKFFLRLRSLFADGLSNRYLVLVLTK